MSTLDRNYTVPVAIGTLFVVALFHFLYWAEITAGAMGMVVYFDIAACAALLIANGIGIFKDNGDNGSKVIACVLAAIICIMIGISCSEFRFS